MNKKVQKMSLLILLVILLVACNNESLTIGEYHKFTTYDFKGMDIMPFDNMSNMKQFSQSQSQELYDYFLTILPEESDMLTDENTPASPDESPYFSIFFHFKESDYNATVGENYIAIIPNDAFETIEDVTEKTSIHLINEAKIVEFVEMINKLIVIEYPY